MTGNRRALVVATATYNDPELPPLPGATADAAVLNEVLSRPNVGGYDVTMLRDKSCQVAMRAIQEFLEGASNDDTLLLHLSCHGLKNDELDLFFATTDTESKFLDSTSIPSDFVSKMIDRSNAGHILLLLDCCFSGAFQHGKLVRSGGADQILESLPTPAEFQGRLRVVMTATTSTAAAFEAPGQAEGLTTPGPALFTGAIAEGLRTGNADRDNDGIVSEEELYKYVYDRVRGQNPAQTPNRMVAGHGKLAVAWRSPPQLETTGLPIDLQSMLAEGNPERRRIAVAGLKEILLHEGPELARAALEVLREVAQKDVSPVSKAAKSVARDAAELLNDITVHFGLVRHSQLPLTRHNDVSSIPLARELTLKEAPPPWLNVEVHEGRLSTTLRGVPDELVLNYSLLAELELSHALGELQLQIHAQLDDPQQVKDQPDPIKPQPTVTGDSPPSIRRPRDTPTYGIFIIKRRHWPQPWLRFPRRRHRNWRSSLADRMLLFLPFAAAVAAVGLYLGWWESEGPLMTSAVDLWQNIATLLSKLKSSIQ